LAVYVKNKDKKVEVAFLMHLSPVFFFYWSQLFECNRFLQCLVEI